MTRRYPICLASVKMHLMLPADDKRFDAAIEDVIVSVCDRRGAYMDGTRTWFRDGVARIAQHEVLTRAEDIVYGDVK